MRAVRNGWKSRFSTTNPRLRDHDEEVEIVTKNADDPTVPISYSGVADLKDRIVHKTLQIRHGAGYEVYGESFVNPYADSIKAK